MIHSDLSLALWIAKLHLAQRGMGATRIPVYLTGKRLYSHFHWNPCFHKYPSAILTFLDQRVIFYHDSKMSQILYGPVGYPVRHYGGEYSTAVDSDVFSGGGGRKDL